MNFYERHIGDYLKDTAHLSLLEHGVYSRLLDVYYTREEPLPTDNIARLIGARSKDEREALQSVLAEFFDLVDGAYRQRRCDAEIARLQDKRRKASESAKARWAQASAQSDGIANADAKACADGMRTHTEGNARAPVPSPQSPDTNTHTGGDSGDRSSPPPAPERPEAQDAPPTPSLAGRACLAMRGANVHDVNPQHPDLLRLLGAGVTPEEIGATAAECAARGKGRMAYVLATVERRRAEAAAAPAVAGPAPQPAVTVPSSDADRTAEMLAERRRKQQMTPDEQARADEARRALRARVVGLGAAMRAT